MAHQMTGTAIIAYNGIDGACAAAMALLRFPEAHVVVASARSIGKALESLRVEKPTIAEVHVCGVGAYCDWDEVVRPAVALAEKDVKIIWYCGRGYLDDQREAFAAICEPVFSDLVSNTDAVCRHLGLKDHPHAKFLLDLAKSDPNIDLVARKPKQDEQVWINLVSASYGEYAKYRDRDRYITTIRKLSQAQHDADDERLVKVYCQSGFRYALEGSSPQLHQLREMIRKCATVDEPILIAGESGVGKEHVAHLIHERGRRATEPFVPVNCATFVGNVALANSVFFGHRKGAFTGAIHDREGAFRAASGGVLFLDELGELPLEVQGKLLRVLEDRMVTPEGADHPSARVDVQLIAATNCNLSELVRRGSFRTDLFYRLATVRIAVPPLRDRKQDIDAIIESTLEALAEEGRPRRLTEQDRKELLDYDWPGNVRQLIYVLRRVVYLDMPVSDAVAEERQLGPLAPGNDDAQADGLLPRVAGDIQPINNVQRRYAERALSLCGGNLTQTAQALGIAVNTLRSWLSSK